MMCFYSVMFTDDQVQEHYDEFFEEIFVELEEKVGFLIRLFVPRFYYATHLHYYLYYIKATIC